MAASFHSPRRRLRSAAPFSRSEHFAYSYPMMLNTASLLVLTAVGAAVVVVDAQSDELTVPAVRVVRLQVDYRNASVVDIQKINKWNGIMRNSVLASLKFINKHWLICGGSPRDTTPNDCGKAQVTGEIVDDSHYRINVTFIAERDPVKNAKVDATSTVFAVANIGLKGGIFQYTNALKVLGKPSPQLVFDEAFFCYTGATLVDGDMCRKPRAQRRLRDAPLTPMRVPLPLKQLLAL
ncbi:unnamed protein product [Caenorhabditis auriculariae]|uniref:Uncharacterized protein n=1 Tax=Caenorhabditis auriculariae TaxID=2777116 RepID=A0A8S1HAJ3_9PELO|nr:unnamed protein product [Caenorhabditis auriculariae]